MNLNEVTAYEVIQKKKLTDIRSTGYLLRHIKTGARVMLIENDDENKVFNIAFRTPPKNSTGVAHILEHSVLCGSREFPLKDPFVELVKGSLNTFLNAMTYPDKTCYPVASCNDQDFQNLMHVYLDAVFYPNIYKKEEIFRQEGWSYHLEQPEGPLTYNGVVYNEMKGAFSSPDDVLERDIMNSLFPDITYSFYDVWANMLRIPYETKALDDDFQIKKEDYYGENGGVVFPNPNAPTGILMPLSEIEDIIAHNRDVIVVVDEAYIDFGGESALPLIEKYDNLLVVQTFSKSRSLAGMRLGFAMGNEKLIRYINDVKYSFNSYTLNQTALVLGVQAIRDREYFEETCAKVIATREWTKCELKKLGFSFGDSMSNFIFATHKRVLAKEIFEALREHNIFVRYFSKPRISNYLRISIGTQQEMERLTAFLAVFLGE